MKRWRRDKKEEPPRSRSITGCWRVTARLACHGRTDTGRVRSSNQDQYLIADLEKSVLVEDSSLPNPARERLFAGSSGKLLVVADGMGGHHGGEEASTLAVSSVLDYVLNSLPWCFRLGPEGDDFQADVEAAVAAAQTAIRERARGSPVLNEMGTTLTMAYVIGPRLFVVHAGDSRCYLLRDGELAQLTTDHTLAQKLVEQGTLARHEARTSRFSHVLWNSLGAGSGDVRVDVHKAEVRPGDVLLLCTDGLNAHVEDAEIARLLDAHEDPEDATRALIDAGNAGGGSDNLTAIVARLAPV